MSHEYDSFGVFTLEEVLPYAIDPREVQRLARLRQGMSREDRCRAYTGNDGVEYFVKMTSARYWLFKSSLSCVVCGRTGSIMILQRGVKAERITMTTTRQCVQSVMESKATAK